MKALLVGGRSALAQALRPTLAPSTEVITAGRDGCDVELDLTWPVERMIVPPDVEVVVNLAAHFGGPTFTDLLIAEETNALGALKLAHACVRAGHPHLVQVSTIFAGLTGTSPFFSSYALSKRHADELLDLYCRQADLALTTVRVSQIYGEGEEFRRHQPVLYALLDKAQRGQDIVLQGRNDALRNFIHVADVAEIITRVVRLGVTGSFTCANLTNTRFSEMAEAAVAAFDSKSTVRFDPDRPNIPDNAFEPDETLFRRIGYFPTISLHQGLAREAARRKTSR